MSKTQENKHKKEKPPKKQKERNNVGDLKDV